MAEGIWFGTRTSAKSAQETRCPRPCKRGRAIVRTGRAPAIQLTLCRNRRATRSSRGEALPMPAGTGDYCRGQLPPSPGPSDNRAVRPHQRGVETYLRGDGVAFGAVTPRCCIFLPSHEGLTFETALSGQPSAGLPPEFPLPRLRPAPRGASGRCELRVLVSHIASFPRGRSESQPLYSIPPQLKNSLQRRRPRKLLIESCRNSSLS